MKRSWKCTMSGKERMRRKTPDSEYSSVKKEKRRRFLKKEQEFLRRLLAMGASKVSSEEEILEEETERKRPYKLRCIAPEQHPSGCRFQAEYVILFFFLLLQNLCGAPVDGVPRDSNFNNTGGYDSTRVEARLMVNVKDNTKVVHFIRDNNDPRVVTKTYLLKNVDAYEFRDYIRQMVQAKRVGNTSLQQQFPGNQTTPSPVMATVSSPVATTPFSAQPTYNPAAQLGSNTAVECLKYADGTGLLIISAEDYRFKDQKNGMGLDSLVEFLDKPQMGAFFGTQTFFYIPKYVPARNLLPLIQNVGMNISDVTELWQGADVVTNDSDLNWLIFDVTNYSMYNIEKMLKQYDVPIPQVRLRITVYEVYDENDDKMGLDFQAWKNNDGVDFFSGGGRFRDNWSAAYGGGMMPTGSERTSFYNFNPKWNSRYIDFLASRGKAKVLHTGEICVRNNTSAVLNRTTQIFYADATQTPNSASTTPDMGVNAYKLLSKLLNTILKEDIPVAKANTLEAKAFSGFGFNMTVNNASVNLQETHFDVTLSNSSLIGFLSNGVPRISQNNSVSLKVSLPHGKDSFVIGGLKKKSVVESENGIPWLCQIPYLGYLFSSKSKSVKNAELIIMGECIRDTPPDMQKTPLRVASK